MKQSTAASLAYGIVLLWGLIQAKSLLVPVLIAGLLALSLAPIARVLHKWGLPDVLGCILVFVGILAPLGILSGSLFFQTRLFLKDYPVLFANIQSHMHRFMEGPWGQMAGVTNDTQLIEFLRSLDGPATQGVQLLFSGLGAVIAGGSDTLLILVFSFTMLVLREHLVRSAHALCERYAGKTAIALMDGTYALLGRFVRARLLIVLVISLADTVILELYGLKYSLLMGSFLGWMTLIPVAGLVISLIPPVCMALIADFSWLGIFCVLLTLLFVSTLEAYLLTPRWVGSQLNINLLTTFIGIFAGGLMWGIWGMLLSIPVLACMRLILESQPQTKVWADLLAETPTPRRRKG